MENNHRNRMTMNKLQGHGSTIMRLQATVSPRHTLPGDVVCINVLITAIRTFGKNCIVHFVCRFTHFDTAEDYDNQVGVGKELKALFASGVKRSDVFITTKTGIFV